MQADVAEGSQAKDQQLFTKGITDAFQERDFNGAQEVNVK